MKFLIQINYKMRSLFLTKILVLTILFVGTLQTLAQEIQTTSSNTQESTIYDQMQVSGDIPAEILNQLDFDPTIQDSVPIPDADWIFRIPISLKNIHADATRIGIWVAVYTWLDKDSHSDSLLTFGRAATSVKLENGAYEGEVLVGVKYNEKMAREFCDSDGDITPPPYQATMYAGYMSLRAGPDSLWRPTTKQHVSRRWLIANPNYPYNRYIEGDIPKL